MKIGEHTATQQVEPGLMQETATAEAGDLIVVLYGANIPFLLRPIEPLVGHHENGDHSSERYHLIGECFVEGFMDGEAFRQEECMELVIH